MSEFSAVSYRKGKSADDCGYCKSKNSNVSYGLYAVKLLVQHYQELIDRGWRRCGSYCYKAVMNETCCPLYTIRCEALAFKPTKSQKKILKKMTKFLHTGNIPKDENIELGIDASEFQMLKSATRSSQNYDSKLTCEATMEHDQVKSEKRKETSKIDVSPQPRSGLGIDANKPKCRKAKVIRLENKLKKGQEPKQTKSEEKSLEDFIKESEQCASQLKLDLMKADDINQELLEESFELYKKYQTSVHHELLEECTLESFVAFLVDSPFKKDDFYGTHHHQYRLNGVLIAVGVIDILPKCVSAVYFFYDPAYSHLGLGTYSALREVELVRKLSISKPDLIYYYMGFYIHSCQKMRYKSRFRPCYLLCPEALTWHDVDDCIKKIEENKYSKFNDEFIRAQNVPIIYKNRIMDYNDYKRKTEANDDEDEEVEEYLSLVGQECGSTMLLFR